METPRDVIDRCLERIHRGDLFCRMQLHLCICSSSSSWEHPLSWHTAPDQGILSCRQNGAAVAGGNAQLTAVVTVADGAVEVAGMQALVERANM